MNDQQIAALAHEYAVEIAKDTNVEELPNCLKNSVLELNAGAMERRLKWLLKRYCLVAKSKLIEEYKSAKRDSKMAHREKLHSMLAVAEARKALIESLFPDIAKEVEE